MDCLVEVDSFAGLKKVLRTKTSILGINNRNLNTFAVDRNRAQKLVKKIPKNKLKNLIVVAESGYDSRADVEKLKGIADAVLVGTSIMASANIESKLKELSGKTLVKICGITNEKDAFDAIRLGADFIGLNFYKKSPRYIEPKKASAMVKQINGKINVVGVFVNEPTANVRKIARKCRLDMLQFSGNESVAYVKKFDLPVIKAIHVKGRESLRKASSYAAKYLMLDSFRKGEYGGTGKTFDHSLMKNLNLFNAKSTRQFLHPSSQNRFAKNNARHLKEGKMLFIAGGLKPGNVAKVVKSTKPFAVDVASGVEIKPGKKSFDKMKAFIYSVRSVQ
jgi:phosphoribosylanthranilate isomerase